jgi:cell division septum initiation protein DivIVA
MNKELFKRFEKDLQKKNKLEQEVEELKQQLNGGDTHTQFAKNNVSYSDSHIKSINDAMKQVRKNKTTHSSSMYLRPDES